MSYYDSAKGKAEVKQGKYVVRLAMRTDDCPDLSYLGEYSNRPGIDAIDRVARNDAERGEYRYWNPANTFDSDYRYFRSAGHCRADAWLKAMRNREHTYKRHESCGRSWWSIGIVATAYVGDVECGSASLWGIESDAGEYLDDTAHDLIAEAIADARANAKRLIKQKAREIAALADVEN